MIHAASGLICSHDAVMGIIATHRGIAYKCVRGVLVMISGVVL